MHQARRAAGPKLGCCHSPVCGERLIAVENDRVVVLAQELHNRHAAAAADLEQRRHIRHRIAVEVANLDLRAGRSKVLEDRALVDTVAAPGPREHHHGHPPRKRAEQLGLFHGERNLAAKRVPPLPLIRRGVLLKKGVEGEGLLEGRLPEFGRRGGDHGRFSGGAHSGSLQGRLVEWFFNVAGRRQGREPGEGDGSSGRVRKKVSGRPAAVSGRRLRAYRVGHRLRNEESLARSQASAARKTPLSLAKTSHVFGLQAALTPHPVIPTFRPTLIGTHR